jgi:6-phosphogluconolactonase (cycloisomerase 2 family)
VLTDGRAACWAIVTADGRFAYVANAGSATLTGFSVDAGGHLTRLAPTTATGTGTTPLDLALGGGDRFVYVLLAGTGDVAAYAVGADGGLTALGTVHAGAAAGGLQGMAAF